MWWGVEGGGRDNGRVKNERKEETEGGVGGVGGMIAAKSLVELSGV